MKIAIYVPSWPPGSSANGIVTYAAQIVPELRRLGHDVFVLTPNCTSETTDPYTIDLNKIETHRSILTRLKSRLFRHPTFFDPFVEKLLSAISLLLEHHKIDVMEIEESFGWSFGIAQAKIIPLVVRLHGPWCLNADPDDKSAPVFRGRIDLEGRGIATATIVTAPSANVLSNVRAYYKLKLDNARVIPNPIHIDPTARAWQLGTCNTSQILYVGRFDRRKGGDIVLRAFAKLAELYPNVRLSFVGPDKGIHQNGHRFSFDEFVRSTLPDFCWPRIEFRGQLSHQDVMALRNEHLFTVIASQFEILPYAVLEAMSRGCPVIASRVGGIPELITDRESGLLFTNQSVDELTSACRELLDNHALASSLGSQARKDCAAMFNVQKIASDIISAYRASIEAHRSATL